MTGNIFKFNSSTVWDAFTKKYGFLLFTHKEPGGNKKVIHT